MRKINYSAKLSGLYDRLVDKANQNDEMDNLMTAFTNYTDYYFAQSEPIQATDVVNIYSHSPSEEGFQHLYAEGIDGTVFIFMDIGSETVLYNDILRDWCDLTGRKLKKKRKSK